MISLYTDRPGTLDSKGLDEVQDGVKVIAHRLWKISKPGVDLVLYTPVEPITGNIVIPGDFYTEDGVRVTYDTIPDGMSALVSTTKNAELVKAGLPDWFYEL